jgi:hypothetical protein
LNRSGRKPGVPNRHTGSLKEMILGALAGVGGREYLMRQAEQNPVAFLGLVGKVLPLQLAGEDGRTLFPRLVVMFGPDGETPRGITFDDEPEPINGEATDC